jgi:poly(A) polymerase
MLTTTQTDPRRQFAIRVVEQLRRTGREAFWAGGCVRDQLLGIEPKDYDVATSATPDEVRTCFGRRRTLAIGASFGVVTVLGGKREGNVEVATFRSDAAYSDGRHPDHVTFSTAREDARRRDFTMNGLFYDPLDDQVIDYVGGQQDLRAGIVRAIGNPHERIAEDKLRMLRAARFAATFGFQLESQTLQAVQSAATTLSVVSAERIAMELRRMLVHPHRARAAEWLRELRLLEVILPESQGTITGPEWQQDESGDAWRETLGILQGLRDPTFRVSLASLLWGIFTRDPHPRRTVTRICERWRLSNQETEGTVWLLGHESMLRRASSEAWPRLQRVLTHRNIAELMTLTNAIAERIDGTTREMDFCRERLQWPAAQLNPPLLITGNDLRRAGFPSGPIFRRVLAEVRDAQLLGHVTTPDAALELARRIMLSED